MAKFQEKIKAQELRVKGLSINYIAKKLNVSKGSISYWCKDIKLTEKQKKKLLENSIRAGHKGRLMGAEMNRRKKQGNIDFYKILAKKQIGKISKRDLLIAGVALYWGEGVKSDKSSFAFINSDPEAIKFMYKFYSEILGVKKENFMPRIFINEIHKDRIDVVLNFWSNLLKLPISQFGNPVFLKMEQKKIYENHDNYFGVLSLKVRKSTNLKYQVLGLIGALKENKSA